MTVSVRDLMTADVISVGPDATLDRLVDLMDHNHIRHVPVLDEQGVLQGLVSHRDLARSTLGNIQNLPLSNQRDVLEQVPVREVMTRAVETVEPDDRLAVAAELMLDHKFGCVPVTAGGRVVGMLTEADFVKYVLQGLEE